MLSSGCIATHPVDFSLPLAGGDRDQVGQGGDRLLGVAAAGFQFQDRAALRGQAHEVQDALAIRVGPVEPDPNLGDEPARHLDKSARRAKMDADWVADLGHPS